MASDRLNWPDDFVNHVVCGDCRELMKEIPDKAIDMVITDPVWPEVGERIQLVGGEHPWRLWAQAMKEIVRVTDRLVVHLNCRTDPRFLMVPRSLPFVRVIWLKYTPPRYHGNILNGADVAYVFGDGALPEGKRVIGGEVNAISTGKRLPTTHLCNRSFKHVDFLVGNCTKENWLILDPFAGTGTTLVAAKCGGRRFIGFEIVPKHCEEAEQRLMQRELFATKSGEIEP